MDSQSITVNGQVRDIGFDRIKELFDLNPYMYEIYPDEESQAVLTVFEVYTGQGLFFDLSQKPTFTESFNIG